MSKLRITEDLTGTEIGFPMSGMPATSTRGKLYRAAFWFCIMMPSIAGSFGGVTMAVLTLVAALSMMALAYSSRKLTLYLDQRTLQIRSPWKRDALPIEEISRFEIVKDDHAGMFYVLAHTPGDAHTVSTLLPKTDAERLHRLLQAGRAARLAEGVTEPARPPAALQALLGEASRRP